MIVILHIVYKRLYYVWITCICSICL